MSGRATLRQRQPIFGFSDTWQLVINTGTTIITFLVVCLIQRSQNKDARAVHLKLNEIVAALQGASNRLINVEDLTETESGRTPPRQNSTPGAGGGRRPGRRRDLASGRAGRVRIPAVAKPEGVLRPA